MFPVAPHRAKPPANHPLARWGASFLHITTSRHIARQTSTPIPVDPPMHTQFVRLSTSVTNFPVTTVAGPHTGVLFFRKLPLSFACTILGLFAAMPSTALEMSPEFRVLTAYRSYSDVFQFAAAWRLPALAWTGARRTEIAAGIISSTDDDRPFLSIGPVWRLNRDDSAFDLEFSFSPTVLGGSRIASRNLGGTVHFTSSFALSRTFGKREQTSVSIRVQHLSNGGLNRENPGLDTIGIGFSTNFGTP